MTTEEINISDKLDKLCETLSRLDTYLTDKPKINVSKYKREALKNALVRSKADYLTIEQISELIDLRKKKGFTNLLLKPNKVRYEELCTFMDKGMRVFQKTLPICKGLAEILGCFGGAFTKEMIKMSWQ